MLQWPWVGAWAAGDQAHKSSAAVGENCKSAPSDILAVSAPPRSPCARRGRDVAGEGSMQAVQPTLSRQQQAGGLDAARGCSTASAGGAMQGSAGNHGRSHWRSGHADSWLAHVQTSGMLPGPSTDDVILLASTKAKDVTFIDLDSE